MPGGEKVKEIDMCTAFVKYGKDYICGFNMDINEEAMAAHG